MYTPLTPKDVHLEMVIRELLKDADNSEDVIKRLIKNRYTHSNWESIPDFIEYVNQLQEEYDKVLPYKKAKEEVNKLLQNCIV